MTDLFVPKPPPPPPLPRMPDPESPEVLEAQKRAREDIMRRVGRRATILTTPTSRGTNGP